MRRRNKKRTGRNKYGSTTVFLSIILTAMILVECTCIAVMWDYDRRLETDRALKIQLQTILSDYNRQLFEVYGIYAFNKSKVDTKIFNRKFYCILRRISIFYNNLIFFCRCFFNNFRSFYTS